MEILTNNEGFSVVKIESDDTVAGLSAVMKCTCFELENLLLRLIENGWQGEPVTWE